MDTLGLVRGLAVRSADLADGKGARLAVTEAECASARLVHVWADSAYQRFVGFALVLLEVVVTIVRRGRKGSGSSTAAGWWSGPSAG